MDLAGNCIRFGGGSIVGDIKDQTITHIVVDEAGEDRIQLSQIRKTISRRNRLPRLVSLSWVTQSWSESTVLDEERFAVA